MLLPAGAIDEILQRIGSVGRVRELGVARTVARRARISLRAATLRLIELGRASWDLYDDIPPVTDRQPEGGGGGGGRNRLAIKEDEFGSRAARVFVDAVRNDLLSRSQAVEYLDIPDAAFDDLASSLSSKGDSRIPTYSQSRRSFGGMEPTPASSPRNEGIRRASRQRIGTVVRG